MLEIVDEQDAGLEQARASEAAAHGSLLSPTIAIAWSEWIVSAELVEMLLKLS